MSPLDDSLNPLLLELTFEDREHTLDWIGVWAVGWSEDVLEAELVDPLYGCVAVVDSEVVHHQADVVEEVPGSELVEPELELLDVDGLLELNHQVNSSLLRDATKNGYS